MFENVKVVNSTDTNVSKFVFTSKDVVAEAVLYRYGDYETRTVICCSTQSGCPVGCRFCGTGEYFIRSLSSDEIVFQVSHMLNERNIDASKIERFQIMFMSMGEPALNQKNLVSAIEKLNELYPNAALLISTSAPDVDYTPIFDVSAKIDKVGLQFSIHESTDEARNKLVPLKKKLNLAQIAKLGESWFHLTGRAPFFNYCVHPENNSSDDVQRILALYNPSVWQATLSVICESDEGVAAANIRQKTLATDFEQKMNDAGYGTRTFDPAGQDDIGGGCGQLWFVQDWMKNNPEYAKKTSGFGLPKVHTPREQE